MKYVRIGFYLAILVVVFISLYSTKNTYVVWIEDGVIKTSEGEEITPIEKTLDGEIDRLAVKYSVDKELATKIIYCESRNLPTAIRINTTGTIDYSYWQINNYYWEQEMKDLGWDIKVPEDNLEAGFYLLNKYGDSLWNWSRFCWNKENQL